MSVLHLIAGVREAANALRTAEADAAEIADACGYVREIEVMLAEWRRTQEARLRDATDPIHDDMPTAPTDNPIDSPTVAGTRYELVPTYTTDRTYNTPRLLVDLAAAAPPTPAAASGLMEKEGTRKQPDGIPSKEGTGASLSPGVQPNP